jgi:hypothetical protein
MALHEIKVSVHQKKQSPDSRDNPQSGRKSSLAIKGLASKTYKELKN